MRLSDQRPIMIVRKSNASVLAKFLYNAPTGQEWYIQYTKFYDVFILNSIEINV